ncbi:MAG: hypothetical protein K8U57_03360 [Planctomycetes bacterium]|nr:hypothetical protein [Planctomycetota bacterium]
MRLLSCVFCCALLGDFARGDDPKQTWTTIKGRVVFPEDKPFPKRVALDINQDKPHCLGKGVILDESVLVNPKNRGIRNVVVFLRPLKTDEKEFAASQIHPDDAKRKPAEVVIDQPCCMFVNRVTVARPGDTIVVKNPAPVPHNFFWNSANNGDYNVAIPVRGDWKMEKPLVAESGAIQYKCTIHGWMTGYVRIFDHPYFAVTDTDGNFEIKNAPDGQFRIVFWHESGVRGGAKGRFGEPIAIAGRTMEMKPTDFDIGLK